jgi:hypothetical protein
MKISCLVSIYSEDYAERGESLLYSTTVKVLPDTVLLLLV